MCQEGAISAARHGQSGQSVVVAEQGDPPHPTSRKRREPPPQDDESPAIFESVRPAAAALLVGLPVSLIGAWLSTPYGTEGDNLGYWICMAMVVGGLTVAFCGAASLWRILMTRKDR